MGLFIEPRASQLMLTLMEIRRDRERGSSHLCLPVALFLFVYVQIQTFKDHMSMLVTHSVLRRRDKEIVS